MRVPRTLLMKPVQVRWLDHEGHGPEWQPVKDVPEEPAVFTTVGYLLKAGPKSITLGSTLDDEKTMTGDTTVLVRSCITSIVELSP